MFKKAIISLVLLLGSSCFVSIALAGNFSAAGLLLQSVPTTTPGSDNGPGAGTHNAGEDCGICHTPGGKAGNYIFTVGGTAYADRAARKPLKGAEIILMDSSGKVISMTSNETGNFWTFTPIANNPCATDSKGNKLYTLDGSGNCIPTVPATDTRTWEYKAWVKYGDQTRHMATIAPIGGGTTGPSSTARMSCNMHHAGMGSRGGLWGTGNPTLASYPTSSLSFKRHIFPIFRMKCVPCHVPGSTITRFATRSDIDTSVTGSLTTVDFSNGQDFTSYADQTTTAGGTKYGIAHFTYGAQYQSSPDTSPVLLHTLLQSGGTVTHGGGGFWTAAAPDYKAIRQWIAEGAKNN